MTPEAAVAAVMNSALNNPFLEPLIDGYLGKPDSFTTNTITNSSPIPDDVLREIAKALPVLQALLPFVPRSLLVKCDVPLCVVEIYSTSVKDYDTSIHFLDSGTCPAAYRINKTLIEYVSSPAMIQKLSGDKPPYRFALTGKNLVCRTANDQQLESELGSPSTAPELNTVFGQFSSHLVLLANSTEPALPGCVKLSWNDEADQQRSICSQSIDEESKCNLEERMFCHCGTKLGQTLPRQLSMFKRDGSVERVSLCKKCQMTRLQEIVEPFIDPKTNFVDHGKVANLTQKPKMFTLDEVADELDKATGIHWPMIPLGALIWSLISDGKEMVRLVGRWISVATEFALRHAPHLITVCPNHSETLHRTPAAGIAVKCEHCSFLRCTGCLAWHDMNGCCPEFATYVKVCPGCRRAVDWMCGCNRLTCSLCNTSFCRTCWQPFPSMEACYRHVAQAGH
jgi:hypothetical protein